MEGFCFFVFLIGFGYQDFMVLPIIDSGRFACICYKGSMDQNKLNHIEELLSYQAKEIQELNDVIVQQGDQINLLTDQVKQIKDKLNVIEEGGQLSDEDGLSVSEIAELNKPPHY